jgi:heat shock protein HslJ
MAGAAALGGSTWQLEAFVEDGGLVPLLASTKITLEFFGKHLGGSAGCNRYNATYSADGERFCVLSPRQTRMICTRPAGVMEQERRFLSALRAVDSYRLADDRLELIGEGGKLACVFARVGRASRVSQPM